MHRALALARCGAGETNPNPMVGAVLVKDGRVVGEAYHARAGQPHAEVLALERAKSRARGATLYLTLEPCAHHGRTPPCAPVVATSGVRRVVAAMRDPNPSVDGKGLALLRRAGVQVEVGLLEREARALNERFVTAIVERRPFVLLKAAITLDGRIATASGDSKWITSGAQRLEARRLRRLHDGVLVGVGTVLADDPTLLPTPRTRRPFHRVVLDSTLRMPLRCRLVRSARRQPVWVVTTAAASRAKRGELERLGVQVLSVASHARRVALKPALRALLSRGVTSLMVEGGSEVLGSFLAERLCDAVALFRAPLLLGGRDSRPAFGGVSPRRLAQALRLEQAPNPLAHYELWRPRAAR
jgi:diaminohydroxyphosphoribosylaminopyrimidine deaminase/5-amino-6-(5-phosphoribosylamino)uracil reductase